MLIKQNGLLLQVFILDFRLRKELFLYFMASAQKSYLYSKYYILLYCGISKNNLELWKNKFIPWLGCQHWPINHGSFDRMDFGNRHNRFKINHRVNKKSKRLDEFDILLDCQTHFNKSDNLYLPQLWAIKRLFAEEYVYKSNFFIFSIKGRSSPFIRS